MTVPLDIRHMIAYIEGLPVPDQMEIGEASSLERFLVAGLRVRRNSSRREWRLGARLSLDRMTALRPASPLLGPPAAMAEKGHDDLSRTPNLNAGFGFSKEPFTGTRGNGRIAPIPVGRRTPIEPPESTPFRTFGPTRDCCNFRFSRMCALWGHKTDSARIPALPDVEISPRPGRPQRRRGVIE